MTCPDIFGTSTAEAILSKAILSEADLYVSNTSINFKFTLRYSVYFASLTYYKNVQQKNLWNQTSELNRKILAKYHLL